MNWQSKQPWLLAAAFAVIAVVVGLGLAEFLEEGVKTTPSLALLMLGGVVALILVLGGLASEAQVTNPQRAIERLEGCSKKERQQRCINILARRPAANGKQSIKAQVRGGRIIWYEYDPKTGNVRRTN